MGTSGVLLWGILGGEWSTGSINTHSWVGQQLKTGTAKTTVVTTAQTHLAHELLWQQHLAATRGSVAVARSAIHLGGEIRQAGRQAGKGRCYSCHTDPGGHKCMHAHMNTHSHAHMHMHPQHCEGTHHGSKVVCTPCGGVRHHTCGHTAVHTHLDARTLGGEAQRAG